MNKAFEKILERLEEEKNKDRSGVYSEIQCDAIKFTYGSAKEIVQEVAEEYNNGWIPCSERLPEPARPVLVTLRNWMNEKLFVRQGIFHVDHWRTDEGIIENSSVVAWKPLPQPYQTKGE